MNQGPTEQPTSSLATRSGYLDMLPIALVNAALVIITINVYLFWAKSRVRGYLWRTTLIGQRPLSYTGDGTELARGFAITAVLFLVLFGYPGLIVIKGLDIDPQSLALPDLGFFTSLIIAAVMPVLISAVTLILMIAPEVETTPAGIGISAAALWLGIAYFATLSRHLTYRYLLRHTRWPDTQGAAGDVPGSPWIYAGRMLVPELSTGLTLGWSAPWRFMRRFELLLDGATFAGHRVSFQGTSKPLYRAFAVTWFASAGLIVSINVIGSNLDPDSPWFIFQLTAVGIAFYLGLVLALAYYNARLFAQVADSIVIDGVGLRFQARPIDLVLLYFTNLVMNLLSAGLSYYYSRMRIGRFIIRHLTIEGQIPPVQSSDSRNRQGLLGEGAEILLAGSYF